MMELSCPVQTYAWGRKGLDSAVAALKAASDSSFAVEEVTPYAELWMGTHPNGPAVLKHTGKNLKEVIEADAEAILGQRVVQEFGGKDLPFLFKVLSVNKALSIQAHPDKRNAELLHAARPEVYKDDNHKPEMAIAITDFEALCGFKPLVEIQNNVREIAELNQLIGNECTSALLEADETNYSEALKNAFTALMSSPADTLAASLSSLEGKVRSKGLKSELDELFMRLCGQYPGDVGCFVIFLVNHVKLSPGEALFLGPNLIHAYLSGDCVECMACSDNVIRAGLTPKYIDVATLCSLLRYHCAPGESMKFKPTQESGTSLLYRPPVKDFAVARAEVSPDNADRAVLGPRDSASIVLIEAGGGQATVNDEKKSIKRGDVLFLKSGDTLVLQAEGETLRAFQAFC